MKTSIKIIAIGVLLSCVACGAKKSTQSNMEKDQQEMSAKATDETQGETAMNDSADKMDGMDESGNSAQMNDDTTESGDDANASADGTTEATSAPSSAGMDYLKMYSELEMTDSQIQDFETGLRNFYTQQKNIPSGEMMGSLSDERERQLKDILSEDQYSTYESWKMDN